MKNRIWPLFILVALIGAFSLSNVAMASRAKLLVMGSGDGNVFLDSNGSGGSFVYETPYDMFWNPALVNNYNNWVIVEKSNYSGNVANVDQGKATVGTGTTATGTTAQGGFVIPFWKFRMGAFFNRVAAVDTLYQNRNNMRPIDLIVGGEASSFKWGLGATYASFRGQKFGGTSLASDHDLTLRAGLTWNDLEPFAAFKVFGREDTTSRVYKYRDMRVGFRYHYGEWLPAVAFKRVRSANALTSTFGASLGRAMRVAEGVQVFYTLGWWKETFNNHQIIPLSVSAEAMALKWLALRGGFSYSFMNRSNGLSAVDNTSGRLGAGIMVSGVDFDWAVGRNGATAETAAATDSQNFDFANGLFTAASLSYKW